MNHSFCKNCLFLSTDNVVADVNNTNKPAQSTSSSISSSSGINYICHHCAQLFDTLVQLDHHIFLKHDKKKQLFQCTFKNCKKNFISNRFRLSHEQLHLKKKFLCNYLQCGKGFYEQEKLWQHKANVHFYKCPFCITWTMSFSHWTNHVKFRHPNLNDPLLVEYLKSEFEKKKNLCN